MVERSAETEKNVKIRLTTCTEGDSFVNEFCGSCACSGTDCRVFYAEGDGRTRTALRAFENRLFVRRSGAVNSRMRFDPREDTEAFYENGGVETTFKVHTESCSMDSAPGKLTLRVAYRLYDAGGFAAPFRLTFEIEGL